MDFISTKEAAAKWGVSQRRVIKLASEGRIEGARPFGINWMIPANAEKPTDARKLTNKPAKTKTTTAIKPQIDENQTATEIPFRFPIYLNTAESSFFPPLSDEEKLLRQAQIEYNACRYDTARKILAPLSRSAKNRYVRICALFHRCHLAVYYNNNQEFEQNLREFYFSFAEDFPYKKEMLLLRYRLDADFGFYESLLEGLHVQPNDVYHPTALDTATLLSLFALTGNDLSLVSRLHLETYEFLCMKMEHDGHMLEAQDLHCALIETYQAQANEDMSLHHMQRALDIALKHELLLRPAMITFYYPTIARKALAEFPIDFTKKIRSQGRDLHSRYAKFTSKRDEVSYLSILSDREFALVSLAVQGYSNRQIAKSTGLSEKTISKRYGDIYNKLGLKSKSELVDLVTRTHKTGKLLNDM